MKSNTVTHFNSRMRRVLLALALATGSGWAAADILHVEIDTTSFGSQGWIDLAFNGARARAAEATATLTDFVGFNAATAAQQSGGVSGSLGSGYTLSNLNGGADLFHAVNLGGKVSFNIDFNGVMDAASNPALSTFSVALYGADQMTLLGNGDAATGSLLHLYWTPSTSSALPGTVSPRIFDSVVSVGPVAPVPEASTWAMMSVGIGLLALIGRRRRQTHATFAAA